MKKEIGSSTQVDQNDFKAAMELFKNCLEAVETEIKQSKKTKETQAAEFFKAACLQRALDFELDNDTPGMDSESSNMQDISVALNFLAQKRK